MLEAGANPGLPCSLWASFPGALGEACCGIPTRPLRLCPPPLRDRTWRVLPSSWPASRPATRSCSRWTAAPRTGACCAAQHGHGPAHRTCVHEGTWCSCAAPHSALQFTWLECTAGPPPNPWAWAQVQNVAAQAGVPDLAARLQTAGGAVGRLEGDGAPRAPGSRGGRAAAWLPKCPCL